jgi:hypothetical protein
VENGVEIANQESEGPLRRLFQGLRKEMIWLGFG